MYTYYNNVIVLFGMPKRTCGSVGYDNCSVLYGIYYIYYDLKNNLYLFLCPRYTCTYIIIISLRSVVFPCGIEERNRRTNGFRTAALTSWWSEKKGRAS